MIAIALLATAAVSPVPYRATGTEPFWSLELDHRRMRLEQAGTQSISEATPAARRTGEGRRYVTRAMTVAIVHRPCRDGMSDRRYPDTVHVTVGRRRLQGCGGPARSEAIMGLADTHWAITALDGRTLRMPGVAIVDFDADGVRARICNNISGGYRVAGKVVRFDAMRSTRMACVEENVMRLEQRFLALAGSPVTIGRPAPDTLTLVDAGGSITLTRRSTPAS